MTAGPPWELDYDAVVERPVSRASLLLYARGPTLLLDADRGEVVALPGIPRDGMQRPIALSPDGTRLLLWCLEDNGRTMLLVALDLDTGERLRLPAPPGCFDSLGAWSPDGRAIATLSDTTDDDSGSIDLIEVATGTRRRLWSCDGGASMHGASIAWSPDGRLIAATYYHAPTDELATAVIDADNGAVVADHEYRVAIGCPNGTWVDNHRVVLVDDLSEERTPPLYLLDVRRGSARRFSRPPRWRYYLALFDGHFLARADDGNLCLTDLDGDDSEPFLTMATNLDISTFDIAPYAIDKG